MRIERFPIEEEQYYLRRLVALLEAHPIMRLFNAEGVEAMVIEPGREPDWMKRAMERVAEEFDWPDEGPCPDDPPVVLLRGRLHVAGSPGRTLYFTQAMDYDGLPDMTGERAEEWLADTTRDVIDDVRRRCAHDVEDGQANERGASSADGPG